MDAILVFDEAESLFGSRADSMSSSTDRRVTAHISEALLAANRRGEQREISSGDDVR